MDWTPEDLSLDNLDAKAVATTPYNSRLLNLGKYRNFHVNGIITEVGTTNNGAVSLNLLLYSKDGTTLLDTIPLLTAIATTTSGVFSVVFGLDFAAAELGAGTIGANAGLARVIGKAKIQVLVDTQADGTSTFIDVYLRAK